MSTVRCIVLANATIKLNALVSTMLLPKNNNTTFTQEVRKEGGGEEPVGAEEERRGKKGRGGEESAKGRGGEQREGGGGAGVKALHRDYERTPELSPKRWSPLHPRGDKLSPSPWSVNQALLTHSLTHSLVRPLTHSQSTGMHKWSLSPPGSCTPVLFNVRTVRLDRARYNQW